MNTETRKLLDHLKSVQNRPGQAPPDGIIFGNILHREREEYENQTRDIVEWCRLTVDEQVQQRLSSTALSQRVSRIDTQELADYWQQEIDIDLMREYLHGSNCK